MVLFGITGGAGQRNNNLLFVEETISSHYQTISSENFMKRKVSGLKTGMDTFSLFNFVLSVKRKGGGGAMES